MHIYCSSWSYTSNVPIHALNNNTHIWTSYIHTYTLHALKSYPWHFLTWLNTSLLHQISQLIKYLKRPLTNITEGNCPRELGLWIIKFFSSSVVRVTLVSLVILSTEAERARGIRTDAKRAGARDATSTTSLWSRRETECWWMKAWLVVKTRRTGGRGRGPLLAGLIVLWSQIICCEASGTAGW